MPNIIGLTIQEALELCKEHGVDVTIKTITNAFDTAHKPGGRLPKLKILRPTKKMRICTIESFFNWMKYYHAVQLEKQDIINGKKDPKECIFIHERTAKRLLNTLNST